MLGREVRHKETKRRSFGRIIGAELIADHFLLVPYPFRLFPVLLIHKKVMCVFKPLSLCLN